MLGLFPLAAHAGGPFGIDHKLALDDDGIWSRKYQQGLEYGVIATEIAGALWLGNDDDLGHTMWQTLDSSQALRGVLSRRGPQPAPLLQLRQVLRVALISAQSVGHLPDSDRR